MHQKCSLPHLLQWGQGSSFLSHALDLGWIRYGWWVPQQRGLGRWMWGYGAIDGNDGVGIIRSVGRSVWYEWHMETNQHKLMLYRQWWSRLFFSSVSISYMRWTYPYRKLEERHSHRKHSTYRGWYSPRLIWQYLSINGQDSYPQITDSHSLHGELHRKPLLNGMILYETSCSNSNMTQHKWDTEPEPAYHVE